MANTKKTKRLGLLGMRERVETDSVADKRTSVATNNSKERI